MSVFDLMRDIAEQVAKEVIESQKEILDELEKEAED